jgi:hypothetical protein
MWPEEYTPVLSLAVKSAIPGNFQPAKFLPVAYGVSMSRPA